jgi:hypothetical protein
MGFRPSSIKIPFLLWSSFFLIRLFYVNYSPVQDEVPPPITLQQIVMSLPWASHGGSLCIGLSTSLLKTFCLKNFFMGLLQFVWEVDIKNNVRLCLNQMGVRLTHNHVIPSAARNPYDVASYKNHHRDSWVQNASE